MKNKGVVHLFLGAMTLLLIFIVIYILISFVAPSIADNITSAIAKLRVAFMGR